MSKALLKVGARVGVIGDWDEDALRRYWLREARSKGHIIWPSVTEERIRLDGQRFDTYEEVTIRGYVQPRLRGLTSQTAWLDDMVDWKPSH